MGFLRKIWVVVQEITVQIVGGLVSLVVAALVAVATAKQGVALLA
jgi:hypothetical protein